MCFLAFISQVSAGDVSIANETASSDYAQKDILTVEDTPEIASNYTLGENDDFQKCIDDANDGDTIILNGTYFLKNTININKQLSIIGAGEGALIKKDSFSIYNIRYFNVTASNVILNNLKFVDGSKNNGGAIYWSGDDGSIVNCNFQSNYADFGHGGAVFAEGKNFRLENSSFTNNRAIKGGSAGAVSIAGDGAIIRNCQFDDNKADNGSAGAVEISAENCLVENCLFTNNYANVSGGAIVVNNKSNRIVNSIFTNNYVKDNLNNQTGGGAIFSGCEGLVVDNCTFTKNSAYGAFGGAIFATEFNTIKNSSFEDNSALLGNAIYCSSFSNVISSYFTLKYNQTQEQVVHVFDLTDINNTFEVIKEDSSVTFIASMVFEYASSGSIYVTVEGGSIEYENISVIGHPEAKITFTDNVLTVSNLNVGEYSLMVVTTPDEAHNSVESFLPITVKKAAAVIKASKITVALKRGTLWTIKIIDANTKKPIAKMKLTLKVYTGKKYKTVTVTTNSKGEASYQTKSLAKGNHKVVVSAKHDGYSFNTLTSYINVVKPTPLTYKVKVQSSKQGPRLSITVYKKATKKQITGVKIKLLVYTGKKYKTVVLKTTTKSGHKGVCGYGTNDLSVGTHKVVIKPVEIKYSGSATSKMKITKAYKKYPAWTKTITGKI